MTPKLLVAQSVTTSGSYENSSAVPVSTRWILKSVSLCPTGAGTAVVDVQVSTGSGDIQWVSTLDLAQGTVVELPSMVLEAGEYLKFKATSYTFDVLAVGYEETVA